MNGIISEITPPQVSNAFLSVGGVAMAAGFYLLSGEDTLSADKPEGDVGYAYLSGDKLTLHDYDYTGPGAQADGLCVGMDVCGMSLTIVMEGNSSITVNAEAKGAGLRVEQGDVTIKGKGTLTLMVQNGREGNLGLCGGGRVVVKDGTLTLCAGRPAFEQVKGKKKYFGESYAVQIAEFTYKGARITGNDGRGGEINKNDATPVVIRFPKRIMVLLPWLLGGVAVLAAGVAVWSLFLRAPMVLTPDYAPVQKEEHAEPIPDDTGDKLESSEGGGAIAMMFSMDVTVDRASGNITLFYGNPGKSNQDTVCQLVVQDTVLAQSGRMVPGTQISELTLLDGAAEKLTPGGYDGILRILSYSPESGEKAIINNDIQVKVEVN